MKMRHHKRTKYGKAQWINAIHMSVYLYYNSPVFGSRYNW